MNSTKQKEQPEAMEKQSANSYEDQYHFHISKISHEIRNPVTLINTYLQLLAQKHPEVTGYEYWNHIMTNMEFLKNLLNEISHFNNSNTVQKVSVNIYAFLQTLADELSPILEAHNIQLTLTKKSALPPLEIDDTKFRQALLNLMRNSIEAIGSDGHITICTYFEDLSVIIEIEDDGPGISEAFIPTLFEPFVTHKKEGTGLGLAITKNVIHAHNGTISVRSKEGKGTVFTMKLPI